jgi:polyamine oxidase
LFNAIIFAFLTMRSEMEYGTESHFVTDPRGYRCIVEELVRTNHLGPFLRFRQNVKQVEYNEISKEIHVHTEFHRRYRASWVISTFALGVYRHHQILFSPQLPRWKSEAIMQFQMETYTKLFFNFPEQFWPQDEFLFLASTRRGTFPVWQNCMAKGYFPSAPGRNVLLITVTGQEAKRLDRLTDETIQDEVMQYIQWMFPNQTIPSPTGRVISRWGSDPLFFGSFTNWPMGMTLEGWQNLIAPIYQQRFFFAGEMASVSICFVLVFRNSCEDHARCTG